jgi:hypothetical protein
MWRDYLVGNRYVQNRVLGDGFGFSKRDLDIIAALSIQGGGDDQESMMIVGNIHNGPLSAIRAVGYVGLIVYLWLAGLVAVWACRIIRRAMGTHLLPLSLFFGLPAIYDPFNFIFIFGAFDASLPATIFNIGMLKMLENSLPQIPSHAVSSSEETLPDPMDLTWRRGSSVLEPSERM